MTTITRREYIDKIKPIIKKELDLMLRFNAIVMLIEDKKKLFDSERTNDAFAAILARASSAREVLFKINKDSEQLIQLNEALIENGDASDEQKDSMNFNEHLTLRQSFLDISVQTYNALLIAMFKNA